MKFLKLGAEVMRGLILNMEKKKKTQLEMANNSPIANLVSAVLDC